MATLFDTIKQWADGQNALNAAARPARDNLEAAVQVAVIRLRLYRSLGDLAAGYLTVEQQNDLWTRLGEEFALNDEQLDTLRRAAHWHRLMELRHPTPGRSVGPKQDHGHL